MKTTSITFGRKGALLRFSLHSEGCSQSRELRPRVTDEPIDKMGKQFGVSLCLYCYCAYIRCGAWFYAGWLAYTLVYTTGFLFLLSPLRNVAYTTNGQDCNSVVKTCCIFTPRRLTRLRHTTANHLIQHGLFLLLMYMMMVQRPPRPAPISLNHVFSFGWGIFLFFPPFYWHILRRRLFYSSYNSISASYTIA